VTPRDQLLSIVDVADGLLLLDDDGLAAEARQIGRAYRALDAAWSFLHDEDDD
jgi:hypothetical protein